MIDKPGIYTISAEEYHSDPCAEPSLSASMISILCNETPRHAYQAHPRLNVGSVEEEKEHFDLGTICHSLVLEGVNVADVLEFPDWRTKAAKEARDASRAKGRVPILSKNWAEVEAMIGALKIHIAQHEALRIDAFVPESGDPELTLVWKEGDFWMRARLDWLNKTFKKILDYKTTGISANPEAVARTMVSNGWDVKAAFYIRGVRAVLGVDAAMQFVVQETFAPYEMSVIGVGPDMAVIGEKKILWAIERWAECTKSGKWPGYPRQTCYPILPVWEEERWLRKEMGE